MEANEIMHNVSNVILDRIHIDPKKLSTFAVEVFSKKRDMFRANKLRDLCKLDRRLKDEVESACALSGLLKNQNIDCALSYLQEEYGYCEPCAQAAFEYYVIKTVAKTG